MNSSPAGEEWREVLNRLYIVVGTLLILIIGAAFVVPRFIDWSNRRTQMETLASEALGRPVAITGPIEFTLLPQPHLKFSGVAVGDPKAPFATARSVTADFSLMDFLRDRFAVTRLSVSGPVVKLTIDKKGNLVAPIRLPQSVGASNVSIADASIKDATLELTDARSGESWRLEKFSGGLKLGALRGPFLLSGTGQFEGRGYELRITTSPMNAQGVMQMASFVRPGDGKFALSAEGALQTGAVPKFTGKLHFQVSPPPASADAQGVRGNLVLDSDVTATADKLLLPNYVLLPDENRSATRLSGAAVVDLGAQRKFDVVASGGVVGLPPRDARASKGVQPFELVQLLNELPAPLVPPMPGRIGIDIAEFDLQAFSLRNVRVDATSDGQGWSISNLSGKLAGDATLKASGTLSALDGAARFTGSLRVQTSRLDALAQMWRKPVEDNPLFDVPGQLSAKLDLKNGELSVSNGQFVLDGVVNEFSGEVMGGGVLNITARLGALSALQSRMIEAFVPPISPTGAFGVSFHQGTFDIAAEALTVDGLAGRQLAARGEWGQKGLVFSQLSAEDLGGAAFTLAGGVAGTVSDPAATAKGRIALHADAQERFLPVLYRYFGVAPEVSKALGRFLPLNVQIGLDPANDKGEQNLAVDGRAAGADLAFRAKFSQGLGKAIRTPLGVRLELANSDPAHLVGLLGLPVALPQSGRARFIAVMQGTLTNSLETQLTLDTDGDKLQYTGSLIVSDPAVPRGRGQLEFDLPEPEVWGAALGAGELYAPHLKGVGQFAFSGAATQSLSALQLDAGGASVSGNLTRSAEAGTPLISGSLSIDRSRLAQLAELLGGGTALISGGQGVWPDGPFSSDEVQRASRGRVSVQIGQVVTTDQRVLGNVQFEASWDDKQTRLRAGKANIGGGTASFDFSYCCAGANGARQMSGRLGLTGVPLSALVPTATADLLAANVTGALQFSGTGTSIAQMVSNGVGSGSFEARDLSIAGMAPGAFVQVASTNGILDLDAKALAALASNALVAGPFKAASMSGVLQLAGGRLQASNLAAANPNARLFGGVTLDLSDLSLSGDWQMTPLNVGAAQSLINENTALISARLGGTLDAPRRTLDLQTMADAIKVRALELEVDRLQKQRAEKEARDRAAAAERARLMALDAKRKAQEAALQAEAQQKAAEAAAAKAAAALIQPGGNGGSLAPEASVPGTANGPLGGAGSGLDDIGNTPDYDALRRLFGLAPTPVSPAPARKKSAPAVQTPDNGAPIDLTLGQ